MSGQEKSDLQIQFDGMPIKILACKLIVNRWLGRN
jgi:hypothetical protein